MSRTTDPEGLAEGVPTVVDEIGDTPLVKIEDPSLKKGVEIYAKCEFCNPGGSVKDRPARRMILEGLAGGGLVPGKVILDSTSGNTGIAYAMIGAALGYPVRLAMPASVTRERKAILAAYGAEVVLTDPAEGSDGAILEARKIYEEDRSTYFKPDQYNNPANWWAHRDSTAKELWDQTNGRITHFVATMGTSGTVMGTGRGLKQRNPSIRVIGAEPADAFHGIEGLKHMESSIVPGIYEPSDLDRIVGVDTEDAYDTNVWLAKEFGLLVGQSSGAAYWAARRLADELDEGIIVTVFCDGGDKYMTTAMWQPVVEAAVERDTTSPSLS